MTPSLGPASLLEGAKVRMPRTHPQLRGGFRYCEEARCTRSDASQCLGCGWVICWLCLGWNGRPLVREFRCAACIASAEGALVDVVPGREHFAASHIAMASACAMEASQYQARSSTLQPKSATLSKVQVMFGLYFGLYVAPPAPSDLSVAAFVYGRMFRVNLPTISADLGALEAWCAQYALEHGLPVPPSIRLRPFTAAAVNVARRYGVQNNADKKAPSQQRWLAYFDWFAGLTDNQVTPLLAFFFIAFITFTMSLIRRTRASALERGAHLVEDIFSIEDLDRVDIPEVVFFRDTASSFQGTLGCRMEANKEKNRHLRAVSVRLFSDDNILGRPVVSQLRRAFSLQHEGAGPILPNVSGTGPWSNRGISRFLGHFSLITGMPRPTLGAQSFRKFYTTELRKSGVPETDLEALGFWAPGQSGSVTYGGNAAHARLDAQRPPDRRRFSFGVIPR
jgi:hypothetical protein